MKSYLLLLFLLAGCHSETGSNTTGETTNFKITGSGMNATVSTSWFFPDAFALTPPPLLDSNLANVDLYEAWIAVKKIHFFRSADPLVLSTSDHFTGPVFVDLLDGTPDSFGNIVMNSDAIRRLKFTLDKSLMGNSMYLRGQVNGHALTFSSDDTADVHIFGTRAITPQSGTSLLLSIRIADLFKKIDLSAITADTNISATNHVTAVNPCPLIFAGATNLYTCFRNGMVTEAKFGKDQGDDDLDGSDETVN